MVVAEILLVLAGHDSSLFVTADASTPPTVAAAFADLLHPGEKVELEALARVSWRYKKIKAAYRSLLQPSKAGQTSPHMAALFVCLNEILKAEYEALIIETEASILKRDESLVASGSFVPLSAIRAIFSEWDAPLAALESLLDHLALLPDGTRPSGGQHVHWPSGKLIDLLIDRSETGVERVASIMSRLSTAVQRVWRLQLTAFLIHGMLSTSNPLADANAAYSLVSDAIPSCVSPQTRESIHYIGKAVVTVRNAKSQAQFPRSLESDHTKLLEKVLPEDRHGFDRVVAEIRTNVSEWIWTNVLTKKAVTETVETFANYFLLKNGEFGLSLIREIERLKISRLTARNISRSGIIREQDLQLALLRASLGTSAQSDPSFSHLRMCLPTGPLRPLLPSLSNPNISTIKPTQVNFNDVLLGTPLTLLYALHWPLDLFLQPSDLQTYADLFAYISSLRKVHTRVLECWTWLSNAQRARRKWTGLGEGGTEKDSEGRKVLLRCGWGLVRDMLWFLDTLLAYIMTDVIDVEFRKLKSLLGIKVGGEGGGPGRTRKSSIGSTKGGPDYGHGGPPPPSARAQASAVQAANPQLDFTTLRAHHARYLQTLLSASLLGSPACATTIRTILEVCERFVAQVERWGGDVLPALLFEGSMADSGGDDVGRMVRERWKVVHDVNEALVSLLESLYEQLSSSTRQGFGADTSIDVSTTMMGTPGPGGRRTRDVDTEMRRHVERLLLRLDFNGAVSKWRSGTAENFIGDILSQGGLA